MEEQTLSQNQDNEKALKLLGVEAVVLLVVTLAIILFLNYLNIIPLSKNYSTVFGFLPHQKNNTMFNTQPASPQTTAQRPSRKTIQNPQLTVSSSIADFRLDLQNKEDLIALLQEWKVYGLPIIETAGIPPTKFIESISVTLTDQEQPLDKVKTPDGNVYLSSNITFGTNDTMMVEVHVDRDIIIGRTSEAGGFLQSQFLRTMYFQQASFDTPTKSFSTLENEALEKLKELGKQGKKYFEIRKL